MTRKMTLSEFTRRGNSVHDGKYDYSKVVYYKNNTNVTIICPIHGDFEQTPVSHLGGSGCRQCGISKRSISRLKPVEDFVEDSRVKHGDKYDYSKVVYINAKTKVIITCPVHGDFEQVPMSHIKGIGCKRCGIDRSIRKQTADETEFIVNSEKVHDKFYSYDKVKYINSRTKVIITCPVHGDFEQAPSNHLAGKGCTKCFDDRRSLNTSLSSDEVVSRFRTTHGEFYSYDKMDYVRCNDKVIITCPVHGDFGQIPDAHFRGQGCPECGKWKRTDRHIDQMADEERSIPYKLYHVRFSNEDEVFDKIGVTKFSVEKRFNSSQYKIYHMHVINIIEGRKEDILRKELEILGELPYASKDGVFQSLKGKFDGWTECFHIEDYDPSHHFIDESI